MSETFQEFFKSIGKGRVLITSHKNADPDALCSAVAVSHLVQTLYPEVKINISFDGLSLLSQNIMTKFALELNSIENSQIDGTIIVDANVAEQLGSLENQIQWDKPVLIIDHHVPHPNTKKIAQYSIINAEAFATTAIIFELYWILNVSISVKAASLICLGILFDSRHLVLADNKTMQIVHQLLEVGINYPEMVELLRLPMDRSERISRIKAAQRLKLYEFNGWLVVISHVSAYQASACRALIRLGADVALVYGRQKNEIQMSGRATTEVATKMNLNLAKDIMEKIGPVMNGEGGGHNTAAGCNGTDNLEEGLKLALELFKNKLSPQL
jgi:phosphoesterase RecJ-like protein